MGLSAGTRLGPCEIVAAEIYRLMRNWFSKQRPRLELPSDQRPNRTAAPRRFILPRDTTYRNGVHLLLAGITALCSMTVLAQTPPDACARLTAAKLPNATVTTAEAVPAGPWKAPEYLGDRAPELDLPAYCRVVARMRPTADSDIEMELWMPSTEWNGKLLGAGNVNWCGGADPLRLALGLHERYATVASDAGHKGCSAADFALGHPEKVADFAYRAVHEMTLKAKALLAAYYGKPPRHSYFSAASSGGGQALMEAQRYPEDYDGIVAGAATNYWTHLDASRIWSAQVAAVLTRPKLALLHEAVLAACDSPEMIGLLDDPRQCRFDPAALLCPSDEDAPKCLTRAQVDAANKIYAGPKHAGTGVSIYPGRERGSELGWGPQPPLDVYRYVVHQDANWDGHTFDLERDVALADEKEHTTLDATDPDLRRFAARGGKLILYHGWDDAIAPQNTVNYYESVIATVGKQFADFIRLFMLPRVGHVSGRGPDHFNALPALERWVEAGVTPDQIVAQHLTKNYVDIERPVCAYPRVPHWKGVGSKNDAANFDCVLLESR